MLAKVSESHVVNIHTHKQLLNIGESKLQIHVPGTVYAGEPTYGRCVSNKEDFMTKGPIYITLVSDAGCSIKQAESHKIDTIGEYYQKNFTVTCLNVSASHITCYTNGLNHDMNMAVTQLEGT